jgi:iron(III) transport system ATP-binding protein
MSSAIAVRCHNLSKAYGAVRAVRQLTLAVPAGQIVALLGPSGCGKTTTLRLLAGFERPDIGQITVDEQVVAGAGVFVPPEKRQVGMVFQNYALFPHLSVAENVAYGLNRTAHRAARVQEVLSMVGLSALSTRMPHELSGGQQQRVALARALAPRPKVLLLDEPFSGLDVGLREQLRAEVAQILRQSGATVIFVTHNQEEALAISDHVVVMNEGRAEQHGTPEEVFGAPATRFVAEFMGKTDFLVGQVTATGILTEIGLLPQRVALPVGATVEIALRPDDVQLVPDAAGSARIVERHYQGVLNLYRAQLPSGQVIHSFQAHTLALPPGAAMRAVLEPGHTLTCFDEHARRVEVV